MTPAARPGPAIRIFAGRWKGRRLFAPSSARPTSGRARQALFNVLGERVVGARVLELYAGSGAVGLEAVSRGASCAVLVEFDAAALSRSLERLGARPPEVRLIAGTVSEAAEELVALAERFDIVFADPPYAASEADAGLARVAELLEAGGLFVLQQDVGAAAHPLPGLTLRDRREYGRNVFLFFGML